MNRAILMMGHSGLVMGLALALLAVAPVAEPTGHGAIAATGQASKKHPGKRLYMRRTCIACHGRNGARAIQDYPNLAGQDRQYLIQQTWDIITGKRKASPDAQGKPRTEAMVGALVSPQGEVRITKDEVRQIADWLSKLPPANPNPPKDLKPEDIAAGEKLYQKKRCFTCHGKRGDKPLKGYPYIAGQKYPYIINQMKDIRDKVRTNGKVKVMYNFVKNLSDQEIARIAAWLSTLDRTAK